MVVGTLFVEVYIPGADSLKEKRQVVKSVVRRVQHRFNVSIAEVNNEDKWQRAQIGVSMVGDDWDHIQRQLQLVINFLDAEPRWEVVRVEMERY
ncbi:MAG: DUF503 domain-containing protein [Firmicutes bacterium]|jgi:uncharacterized protein YlxP (DUF503 family)|nr:DUF503 domain-containing protein [Bacillota bacterium]NLO65738.1 DUF503 domain-containing protein [Bacillota bacterium]